MHINLLVLCVYLHFHLYVLSQVNAPLIIFFKINIRLTKLNTFKERIPLENL
jgi:hypothetical protein